MRILIDECMPRKLKQAFSAYDVATVQEMRWSGKKNGVLLRLMAAYGFGVLLTSDQNLSYQQSIESLPVAVIVMVALTNKLSDLLPLVPQVETVLRTIVPGTIVEVQ